MTPQEKIAVMQAFLDGKVIEVRNRYSFNESLHDWHVEPHPTFNFMDGTEYRVQPPPPPPLKEIWVNEYKAGGGATWLGPHWENKANATGAAIAATAAYFVRTIHFREVREEKK